MRKILFICLILSIFLSGGCAKQPTTDTTASEKSSTAVSNPAESSVAENTVTIAHFVFEPSELTIKAGDTVTWKQDDNVAHTVVSEGLFESGTLNRGDEYTFTFTTPGEYEYRCGIHSSMRGKIIVK